MCTYHSILYCKFHIYLSPAIFGHHTNTCPFPYKHAYIHTLTHMEEKTAAKGTLAS